MPRATTVPWPKEIEVDTTAINKGRQGEVCFCPIAKGIKAAIPDATHITVDVQMIKWSDKTVGKRFTFLTPRDAAEFLQSIDYAVERNQFPNPFTLRLPRTAIQEQPLPASGNTRRSVRSNGAGHEPTVVGGGALLNITKRKGAGRTRNVRVFGVRGLGA